MSDKTEMILMDGAQDADAVASSTQLIGATGFKATPPLLSPDSATTHESQNVVPPPLPPNSSARRADAAPNNGESFTYKYQYEAPKKSGCGRSCLQMIVVFFVGFMGLCFLGGLFSAMVTNAVMDSVSITNLHASGEFSNLTEERISGHNASNKVLRLAVSGMITLDAASSAWGSEESSSAHALRSIRKATGDRDVRGILLQVNSGGGGVTASDIIWNALEEFKKARYGRFVVVLMGDTAASGAYYISAGADCIVAHPTTLTGSIGVIVNSYNIRELADKIGLKSVTIKSGENKSMLSPFEDMTPAQEAMLQKIVDALHTRFVGIVAEGRKLELAKVKNIADGRVLLADEALAHGLIDKIGYLADAKREVEKKLGGEAPQYITYTRQSGFLDLFKSPSFWGKAFSAAVKEATAETTQTQDYETLYK